jgi:hypothetical protein
MSDILIKSNIKTGEVNIVLPAFNPLMVYWNIIHIKQGFFDETSNIVMFDNVSFGHKLYLKNTDGSTQTIHEAAFPRDGLNPVSTDLEFEESTSTYVDPENTYIIEAWFRNAGKSYQASREFVVPAPPDFEKEFLIYHPDFENVPPEYEHPLPPGALEQMPVPDYETSTGAYKPTSKEEGSGTVFTKIIKK